MRYGLSVVSFLLGCCLVLFSLYAKADITGAIKTPTALYYPDINTIDGNPKGKVTVVEFFDYRCGYCRASAPILANFVRNHPNVRVVYRDYPLLGTVSRYAALAAVATGKQNKYGAMHAALFGQKSPLDNGTIIELAGKTGANPQQVLQDMQGTAVQQQLQVNSSLAQSLNISGVPVFIIARTPARTKNTPTSAYMVISPSYNDFQTVLNRLG